MNSSILVSSPPAAGNDTDGYRREKMTYQSVSYLSSVVSVDESPTILPASAVDNVGW
jgi:hypothetical protein